MRVLHVGKYFPPEPGGIERFLDELTLGQLVAGLEPSVLAHDRHGGGVANEAGRTVYRCRSHGQMLFTPLAPGWLPCLARALREQRPQILHLHLPNPAAFAVLALPAARSVPWVLHWHADVPLDTAHRGLRLAYPVYARFESALLRRAAAIIATSSAYLEASAALAAHRARCHVVPLGLGDAPQPDTAAMWPAPGLRVLAVGRLSYYKGFSTLIEAVAGLDGVSLVIAGRGDQQRALERCIEVHGVGDRVSLLSDLTDAGIEASYRACDVLCLPSIDRAEAFGLVLLEAMRAGRAVVASRLPGSGMSEVVVDGETGLQVRPGSMEDLRAALSRLRDDPALRASLGEGGRRRFDRCYRLPPVTEAIARIYRSVVPADPAAAPAAG